MVNDRINIMNKYRNTDKDIHTRIYRFVISCFRDVVKKIPKTTEYVPLISQLSSSLTSMGANDQEADVTGSKKDFIAKYFIVKKETSETKYWLLVLRDTKAIPASIVDPFIQECQEILLIVSKILQNTRGN